MDRYQQALRDAFEQGRRSVDLGLQQTAATLRQEFEAKLNRTAGGLRKQIDEKASHLDGALRQLSSIASAVSAERSIGAETRPGTIRIEDIPGRRVPFTLLVDIPIANGTTTTQESPVTISQEGPFVAVRRMAIFQSALEVQTTDPTSSQIVRFSGRSFGRYRPIASAWDLLDSQHNAVADTATWWLSAIQNPAIAVGSALPSGVLGMPSSMASFRTMEFDGRIEVINAGSSFPRQNISVPSAFWCKGVNGPWDLGALDFFERNEVLTIRVQPLHVNNPAAGNVDGSRVFPQTANAGTGWPFLDGQFDAHEGICTPGASTVGSLNPLLPNVLATDSVVRVPDGILTIGWEGYRILQPIGPAV